MAGAAVDDRANPRRGRGRQVEPLARTEGERQCLGDLRVERHVIALARRQRPAPAHGPPVRRKRRRQQQHRPARHRVDEPARVRVSARCPVVVAERGDRVQDEQVRVRAGRIALVVREVRAAALVPGDREHLGDAVGEAPVAGLVEPARMRRDRVRDGDQQQGDSHPGAQRSQGPAHVRRHVQNSSRIAPFGSGPRREGRLCRGAFRWLSRSRRAGQVTVAKLRPAGTAHIGRSPRSSTPSA